VRDQPGQREQDDWDAAAATFDDEPDHGLRDPAVRAAWSAVLLPTLPPAPARVADLGCGTGTLAVLIARAGYAVTGLDLSARMVAASRAKAHRAAVHLTVQQGDAAAPPFPAGSFDVVLARHVLWMFTDPVAVLARWAALLATGGRLVLVEGRWAGGGGITGEACHHLVRQVRGEARLTHLQDPGLWGKEIDDERYLLVSER
jgi:SAM-dependent methyltransferase